MSRSKNQNIFVEFHLLTSHAPSNLNRDDLGSPKTAMFGGIRRLRISSQCLKRTMRLSDFFRGGLAAENLGIRTQKLREEVQKQLADTPLSEKAFKGLIKLLMGIGRSEENAIEASRKPDEEQTRPMLFLSQQEINEVKRFSIKAADELSELFDTMESNAEDTKKSKAKDAKKLKAENKLAKIRKDLEKHLQETCKRNVVDLALFGRFVTSSEIPDVDAAMQVAHALGTQKVEVEYDYFVAVDDLGTDRGAGFLGQSEFASAVFYKYAVCDLRQLIENLDGDVVLAGRGLSAFCSAMARAVPMGKKNSTAPQNPADYVEIVVRRSAPVSLANAFLKPVRPTGTNDVMDVSILQLRKASVDYDEAYTSNDDVIAREVLSVPKVKLEGKLTRHATLKKLTQSVKKWAVEYGHKIRPGQTS